MTVRPALPALALIVGAFFLRGAFYCVLLPAWEGFDEWAHFARAQHTAVTGASPNRTSPVSPEIQRSLKLLPLPHGAWRPAGAVTHTQFWDLPADVRLHRQSELLRLPVIDPPPPEPSALHYQAQQPPLYYVPMAALLRLVPAATIPDRILLLRLATLILACCALPLCYAAVRSAFVNSGTALAATISAACLPSMLLVVCRVSNDALFILLSTSTLLFALLATRRGARRDWALFGLSLAAALLTKAAALALLVLIPAAFIARRGSLAGPALATIIAALAAPWYWSTWRATSTLAGEQTHAAVAAASFSQRLDAVASMQWGRIADVAAFTHIWTGGWSFLLLRSWMYRVFEILALGAAAGLLLLSWRFLRRRSFSPAARRLILPASAFSAFILALAYHAVAVFLAGGPSATPGWYLNPCFLAELILFGWGFSSMFGRLVARHAFCLLAVQTAALDLYSTTFILAPYYSGLIRHRPSGSLTTFPLDALTDPGQLAEIVNRLAFHDSPLLGPTGVALLWCAYLLSTLLLMIFAARLALRRT